MHSSAVHNCISRTVQNVSRVVGGAKSTAACLIGISTLKFRPRCLSLIDPSINVATAPLKHTAKHHLTIRAVPCGLYDDASPTFLIASHLPVLSTRPIPPANERYRLLGHGRMKLTDLTKNLNFFRYHLLFFTFTPLIFSGIFYAVTAGDPGPAVEGTGVRRVEYIDALFLCFSAMT